MPTRRTSDLHTFIRGLPAERLAELLLELAEEHEAVAKRLKRLQLANDPKKLAAGFRTTLAGWKRGRSFIDYQAAREFTRGLRDWLAQIERELLPLDPPAVLELAQGLIESDAQLMNRVDDSDGLIGDAMRGACRLWLHAAAACESPASEWPDRLDALAADDDYGVREALYAEAHLLLDESALRALAARHQARLEQLVGQGRPQGAATESPARMGKTAREDIDARIAFNMRVYPTMGTLSNLAAALRDPRVKAAALLTLSPQPNSVQLEDLVRACLDWGHPEQAFEWLDRMRESESSGRLRSEALAALGRTGEAAAIHRAVFDKTLHRWDLQQWLALLPEAERDAARGHARKLALEHRDPLRAAQLLVEIGEHELAEDRLATRAAELDGDNYHELAPLAETLDKAQYARGATALYRALLDAILAKARSTAYRIGQRYLNRLAAMADSGAELAPLAPHAEYVAALRKQHARKVGFWSLIDV